MISPGTSSRERTLNTRRHADSMTELSPQSGPGGERPTQMETGETEASSHGSLMAGDFSKEEELSSQMFSFTEATTQTRELEERGHGRAQGDERARAKGQAGLSSPR